MKIYLCEQSDYDSHTVQLLCKNKKDADHWLTNAKILMSFAKKVNDVYSDLHSHYIENTNEEVWGNPDSDNMYAKWWKEISEKLHEFMRELNSLCEKNHVDDFYSHGGSYITEREVVEKW